MWYLIIFAIVKECYAVIAQLNDPPNDLIAVIKEYSEYTEKHYNHSYIERGVCIATKCKKYINNTNSNILNLNANLEACLNQTIWNNYGLQAKLTHVYYCNKQDEEVKYDWSDWLFGGILLLLVSINIIGSFYDLMLEKYYQDKKSDKYNNKNPYLLCFSIPRNWESLTSIKLEDRRVERLKGLHGIRVLTSFLIPLAHVMWLIGTGFTDNPQDIEKASESTHYQLIFNGLMIVQIFFVMSGFLMVYNLEILSEIVPIKWSLLPNIFLNRLWRLTPANSLIILFTATWLRYLGSGPLWKLYVTSVVSGCRQYWWAHIFYINNYFPEDKACAVHTWHLAADMQLFFLGSIVYIATKTKGRSTVIALLLLFSVAAPALHVWFQDLDALVIFKPEFYRSFSNDTYWYLHILGHNNLSCFIIGMVTGYFAYYCQKNRVEVFKHKIWQYLAWCVIPGIAGLILTGSIFYTETRLSLVIRMAYAAIHRPILGVIIAFIILGLVLRIENVQLRLLEWDGWVVPSKLSYCAYLLHLNIVHILLGARTQLGHVSFFYVVINHLGIVFLSYLAAIPLSLMVEVPFNRLKTLFQDTSMMKKKKL
ncbi:unnamed protein product [Parnassius apollo]|uniref:(apollo) hypothetical protein n=1 Tax=Parnassius apollo TaxID=110799 RepID=A0A8S3XB88_PARAO|nr:unnamed protein product [Parnassius apollo]